MSTTQSAPQKTPESSLRKFQDLDILSLIRANDVQRHTKDIRGLLDAMNRDLDAYDKEMDRLEILKERLRPEKAAVQAHASICASALAPIRRLPAEILERILEYVCEAQLDEGLSPLSSLMGVCSHWRHIARSSPAVWKLLGKAAPQEPWPLEDLLKMCDIPSPFPPAYFHEANFSTLFNYFKDNFHLCQDLLIESNLVHRLSGLTPNLRELRLVVLDGHSVIIPPGLRRLDCSFECSNMSNFPIINIKTPADQLTTISLDYFPYGKALDLVAQAPDLKTLLLSHSQHADTANRLVVCPNLSSLTLIDDRNAPYPNGTLSLKLPNLKHLSLSSPTPFRARLPDPWLSELLDLFHHSNCALTQLQLSGFGLNVSGLLPFLQQIPSLIYFSYECGYRIKPSEDDRAAAQGIMEALTLSPEATWGALHKASIFLPHLAQLELQILGFAFTDQSFVDMVSSRWLPPLDRDGAGTSQPSVASLSSVRLAIISRTFDDSRWKTLRRLQRQGLRIGITDAAGDVRTRVESSENSDSLRS